MATANKKERVTIEETHQLPSRGILYKGKIPGSITLRAMNTLDEKRRLSSNGYNTIPRLIKSCIVGDDIDTYKLKVFDLQYLMYKLRTITYGPDYKIDLVCPNCGKRFSINKNLDEIPVRELPDDFKDPFEIGPLPISGDTIECNVFDTNDYIDIEKEGKRTIAKFPNYEGDPEFIPRYMHMIDKVNGAVLQPSEKQEYIENMHARDLRFIDSAYETLVNSIGLVLDSEETCPQCDYDIEYTLPTNREFFRPTYSV